MAFSLNMRKFLLKYMKQQNSCVVKEATEIRSFQLDFKTKRFKALLKALKTVLL